MNKLDIVVPCKNEAGNLVKLTERVDVVMSKNNIDYRIVFVDDYSTDSTAQEVLQLIPKYLVGRESRIVLHKKQGKPGKAFAILEGIKKGNAEFVAMIDGDLQYPPEALPEMLKIAEENGVAVANRVTHKTSKFRKVGSKFNSFVFGKVLLGLNCDVQSGLKVFRREIIEHVDEQDVRPWAIDVPLLHTAKALGYEIGHTEIEFKERANGVSKVNYARATKEIVSTTLKHRVKRNRTFILKSSDENGVIGAGVVHKKKRYITHTTLPLEHSALTTFTTWQKVLIASLFFAFFGGLLVSAKITAITFVAILSVIYLIDVIFNTYILVKSLESPPELKFTPDEIASLNESSLPVYSILCPLYKEGDVLPQFFESINGLDWPKEKLDVLLLLEEDDEETRSAAEKLNLPSYVRVVVVPNSMPKTKPKACNYGLAVAKGEYVVIYDAEDRPDPLQLKKAYLGFQKSDRKVFCLQGKLNYYNPEQNILTRLFTAEYSLWFDILLPGLQSIETNIPLGGTSNHFRTLDLQGLHAWDPFNVTEDCDLGVRVFKNGYKTAIIDSTTYEEANSRPKNWIRQRSRWIKGYLQTYLVHQRNPIQFIKEHKTHALVFQLVIGMRMFFMLINPFLWLATILYFAARGVVGPVLETLYPSYIFYIAVTSLIFGNFTYIYNYMIGCAKRRNWSLIKYVFLVPFYWLMASVAAYAAVYQLIAKPHYWEKTDHGFHLGKKKTADVNPKVLIQNTNPTVNKKWSFSPQIAAGSALVIATGIASVLNLAYNAYLGRALSVEDFGTLSLLSNFFTLSTIVTAALSRTVAYKSSYLFGKLGIITKEFWSSLRRKALVTGVILVALWLALVPSLARSFSTEILPILLFTPTWFLSLVGAVDSGFLNGNHKFVKVGIIALIESILKVALAVLFINSGYHEWVYAAIPLSLLGAYLFGWVSARLLRTEKIVFVQNIDLTFPTMFMGTSILTRISGVAFLSLDVVLAKIFLNPTQAGEYALLSLAGKIIFFLGSIFAQFIVPVVGKIEGEGKDTHKAFLYLTGLISLVSLIGFIGIGLLGSITVPLIFGSKAESIVHFLPIYAFGMASFTVASSLVVYNQVKKEYIFPFFGFVLSIIEVGLIINRHNSVNDFVNVVSALSMVFLAGTLTIHLALSPVKSVIRNIVDLILLFARNGHSRNNNQPTILIYNWRDKKHVWAGGAELYIDELAKKLVKNGFNITIFCGNDGGSPRNEKVSGVKVVRRGGFYTVYFWAFAYYILKFRGKYDLIIESENGIPFFTPLYARIPKVLLVHHVHSEVFRNHLSRPLSMLALFVESHVVPLVYKNTKLVTVSDSSKKDLIAIGRGKNGTIEIIPPGVKKVNAKFRKSAVPSFVYVGRLKAYKSIDTAIKAFAEFVKKYPEGTFDIAGEGESLESLANLSEKLGVKGNIRFHGRVSEEKKYKLLGEAWASIQPSTMEGWGITVIEANSVGTPVIASNTKGLRDSVIDRKTGLLFKTRNEKDLFDKMLELTKNENFRIKLGVGAKEWSKNFTWEKSANKFVKIMVDESRDWFSEEQNARLALAKEK